MGSRSPVLSIAKKVGCGRSTVVSRIKFLEEEFGLFYTVEFDLQKLGFPFCYLISARLRRDFTPEELAKIFSGSQIPQFIAMCKGEFDLLFYAVAKNQLEYLRWEYKVRTALEDDIITWKASHVVFMRHGFFRLNEETIMSASLPSLEKRMLVMLDKNARMPFHELAKSLGCSLTQVRYAYRKLVKRGAIKRFTAVMRSPPFPHHVAFFHNDTFRKDHEELSTKVRKMILGEGEHVKENLHAMVVETSGAADGFDWVAGEELKDAYHVIADFERLFQGAVRMESAATTKVLLGYLPAEAWT